MQTSNAGEFKVDRTLIPLLDLVLQLVMFFMICANFVQMEEQPDGVKLPWAQSAKPMDITRTDLQFLNINSSGDLVILGQSKPLSTTPEIRFYLKQLAEDIKTANRVKKDPSPDDLKTTVIIRADKDADFARVYEVMRLCKEVGFRRLQLRARQTGA